MYAIQNAEPAPLPTTAIPPKCRQILTKALQKNLDTRYQQVRDLVADLHSLKGDTGTGTTVTEAPGKPVARRMLVLSGGLLALVVLLIAGFLIFRPRPDSSGSAGKTPALHRLAVLPFTNLRSDPETDFLGFALADQVIGNLSYLKNLVVRPSSAIRSYQNTNIDLATAGQNLNVDLVLTGNYLKEANTIRLTVELADVHRNAIVWRGSMQERYENTFGLEDTVARKVVEGLRIQFSPEEIHQMKADVSRNPLAYEYYLRGLSYPVTLEGNTQAVAMMRQSIALDSTFAPAYDALGYRLRQLAAYAGGQQHLTQEARSAFLKAIALNGQLMSSYGSLVSIYTDDGRTEEAYETVQKILTINPNSPEGHFFLGYVCRYAGFLNRAEQEMEKALSLDPKNPRFRSIGITYAYLGKYQKALTGFDLDSTSSFSKAWKAQTLILAGQPERALPYLTQVLEHEPESRLGLFCQEMKIYVEKRFDLLPEAIRKSEEVVITDGESWYNLSQQLGRFGDAAGAARTLQKAVDGGFFNYPLMLRDPLFESVRQNAEVRRVMANAKTKHETFKERHPELREER